MIAELYRLDFPNGKSYVGISKMGAEKRYATHARDARRPRYPVHRAWAKHGAPVLVVLATGTWPEMKLAEVEAIAKHGTLLPGGYNVTKGGDDSWTETPEGRAFISELMKGNKNAVGNRNAAGRRSEEQRRNMSLAYVNRWTPESRAKVSATTKGRTKSAETRAKMAAAQQKRRAEESVVVRGNLDAKPRACESRL